jgi:PAS domain S-box-containing protein
MSISDRNQSLLRLTNWVYFPIGRYAFAVLLVGTSTLAHATLHGWVGPHLLYTFFYPAIVGVAVVVGVGPAICATFLSAISAWHFFLGRPHLGSSTLPHDATATILFSTLGIGLSVIGNLARKRALNLQEHQKALEGSSQMIIVLDRDYRYVIANRAFLNYRGLRREDVLGKRLVDLFPPGVFENTVKSKLDECFEGKVVTYEKKSVYPTIGERDISVTYFPIEGATRVDRVACVFTDLTELNQSQKRLDEKESLFRALVESSPTAMVVSLGDEQRADYYNPRFTELFGYTWEDVPDVEHWWRLAYPDEEYRRQISTQWNEQVREAISNKGETSPVEATVRCKDGSERTVEFKFVCAGEKNLVFATDLTSIKNTNRALMLFRTLIDESNDAVEVVDPQSLRFLDVNERACKDLGYTRQELLSLTVRDIDPTVHSDECAAAKSRTGLVTIKESIHRRKDGSTFPVEISLKYVTLDRSYVVAVARDITERKRVRDALRESEDRYRDLVEHSEDLVCTHDLAGNLLSVNAAPARVLGYTVDELLKTPMREFVAPEFRKLFDSYLEHIGTGGSHKGLLTVMTRDGERRVWEYNNTLRTDGVPSPVVRGMARDVTEQKRAEDALRRREEDYRMFVSQSSEGIFREELAVPIPIDLPEDEIISRIRRDAYITECNNALAKMYGFNSAKEMTGKHLGEMLIPDDEDNMEMMREYVRSGFRILDRTSRERDDQGNAKTFLISMIGVVESGKLVHSWGIQRDVTERVKLEGERTRAEKGLRSSELHFRLLFEQASDGIFISDAEGHYEDVNSAGAEMLGYTREEILQLFIPDIVTGEDRGRVDPELARTEGTDTPISEWTFRRKDGSTFSGEVSAKRLPDGRIQGILRDISERKRAQEETRRNEDRFRVALKDSPITVFNQDTTLRYTWIYNPRVYQQQDVIGKTDEDILGHKAAARLMNLKRQVLKTGETVREEVVIMYQGKRHAFDVNLEPLLAANGSVIGLTGTSMDIARLREMTDRLQDARDKLAQEKSYLESEIQSELGFEEIVGQSSSLRDVLKKARIVAPTDSTVLLLGETGTGKELVARSVHSLSTRRDKTFIKLNCAAVPSGLLESELFGHEKGAFTSAVNQKVGRIELADGGTLFLDEVGELPLELQPKLLRVLQDREFERLGGNQTLKVNVRIISATNRDLQRDIADRRFREDLFYRLNVFPIELPPLRERRSDIPMLIHHFVEKHGRHMGKHIDTIPDETLSVLQAWGWPGNIRELENMIERMVILTKDNVLAAPPMGLDTPREVANDTLTGMEREHIIRVLRETGGVLSGEDGAAIRLGMKRTTLQSMLKRLGIELLEFRGNSGTYGSE